MELGLGREDQLKYEEGWGFLTSIELVYPIPIQ
jgi:hypothetical protein